MPQSAWLEAHCDQHGLQQTLVSADAPFVGQLTEYAAGPASGVATLAAAPSPTPSSEAEDAAVAPAPLEAEPGRRVEAEEAEEAAGEEGAATGASAAAPERSGPYRRGVARLGAPRSSAGATLGARPAAQRRPAGEAAPGGPTPVAGGGAAPVRHGRRRRFSVEEFVAAGDSAALQCARSADQQPDLEDVGRAILGRDGTPHATPPLMVDIDLHAAESYRTDAMLDRDVRRALERVPEGTNVRSLADLRPARCCVLSPRWPLPRTPTACCV